MKNSSDCEYGIIEYSIKYPSQSSDGFETYVSLLVATAGIPFLFPLFMIMGYTARVRAASLNEEVEPPNFDNYEKLIKLGINSLIAYIPILTILMLSVILSILFTEFLLGLGGISLALTPIVSVKFAETQDYKQVYDGEIVDILLSDLYSKYLGLYVFSLVFLIFISITLSVVTLGFGLIVMSPIILWSRAAYWGKAISRIRNDLED